MEDLQIQPTKKTPLIDFYTSGKLILAGSVYPENSKEFFEPVIDWIRELEAHEVDFDMIVEYMNTSAAKKIWELLKSLQANKKVSSIKINWFYQEWDDDILETGKILADSLPDIGFNFVVYEDNRKKD
jgi:hypothetical protein